MKKKPREWYRINFQRAQKKETRNMNQSKKQKRKVKK